MIRDDILNDDDSAHWVPNQVAEPMVSKKILNDAVPMLTVVVAILFASQVVAFQPPPPEEEELAGLPPQEWFWPDPFSHLGSIESAGDGWHYLAMGSDAVVQKLIGLTAKERQIIGEVRQAIVNLDRNRRAGGGNRITERSAIWDKAARTASKVVAPERDKRLRQLLLQRLSFRAFVRERVIKDLALDEEQQKAISAAISDHSRRLQQKNVDHAARLARFDESDATDEERHRLTRQLTAERGVYGRASHREVWNDIRDALSEPQQKKFNELRGTMPETMRSRLRAFPELRDLAIPDENDEQTWHLDKSGIEYRIRLAESWKSHRVSPLLYLDLRNRKNLHKVSVASHQSQQSLWVNALRFKRFGQPWGATVELTAEPITLPFVLTSDWRVSQKGAALILSPGLHAIVIELDLIRNPEPGPRPAPGGVEIFEFTGFPRSMTTKPIRLSVEIGEESYNHADRKHK